MFKNRFVFQDKEAELPQGGASPETTADEQIRAAVEREVAGLKAKNNELLGKLRETSETLKRFDGINPDEVRNLLSRISESEEAKLIADGKMDEVLNKRTERMKQDYESKLLKTQEEANKARETAQRYTNLVLENALRQEAIKAGVHQHAIDDALFRGKTLFQLGDDLKPIAAEGLLSKDGVSSLGVQEWLQSMREVAPHWFPSTASGAGTGRAGVANQVKNRSQMSAAEKASYISKHGQEAFFKLPN